VKTEQISAGGEWLNFHHLRYFWAVARHGTLRRTAEVLHVSQPSISAQIKLLESALGQRLFRRSGRSLVLTDFGRIIQGYAEEIFTLGRELLAAGKRGPGSPTLRLNLGVVDSFPKLLTLHALRPVLEHDPLIQITVQEGKLDELLRHLAAHRLDAVLADEPPSLGTRIKTFTHAFGRSGITFCALPSLARKLRGPFPRNLNGAPLLLPAQNTLIRRELEKWFRRHRIEPVVIAEFEDLALAQIVASDAHGVTVVSSMALKDAMKRFGFVSLGATDECVLWLYLITVERRIEHPAIALIAHTKKRTAEKPRRRSGKFFSKKVLN
jgi:LysR family transcriptional regulator, transcriptional activator of nhaA